MNQSTEQKIDCVVRVVTPENIEFEYLLAGPFQRLPAFLIDFAVRVAFFVAMLVIGLMVGIPLAGSVGLVAAWVLGFIGFFVLSWAYGAIMEAQFNGRTIGKILLGLRVISTDGRPINASQATIRNMLRLCDLMPPLSLTLFFPEAPPADAIPTFFVGLVAMTLTRRMQRIGDLAAGTMVVCDGRRGVSTNLQPEDARAFALAEYIPPTFQISRTLARTVGLYMERRRFLSPVRRQEIASNLAEPLLVQFELRPDTSADLLLCALYVRIYHSEQQRQAKLQSLRGQSYTRPSLVPAPPSAVTLDASLHATAGTAHSTISSTQPTVGPTYSTASAAHSTLDLDPALFDQPTLVQAEPVEDDVLEIIEAEAVEYDHGQPNAAPPAAGSIQSFQGADAGLDAQRLNEYRASEQTANENTASEQRGGPS